MTTPFHAQRAKLRDLTAKQEAGEPDLRISAKAAARRRAEAAAAPVVAKKKVSKKTSASTT